MKNMLAQNDEIKKKNSEGEGMSTAEIGELLRAQPLMEAQNKNYQKHLNLLNDVITDVNSKRKIKKIINAE
jgi:hypothetical protein